MSLNVQLQPEILTHQCVSLMRRFDSTFQDSNFTFHPFSALEVGDECKSYRMITNQAEANFTKKTWAEL